MTFVVSTAQYRGASLSSPQDPVAIPSQGIFKQLGDYCLGVPTACWACLYYLKLRVIRKSIVAPLLIVKQFQLFMPELIGPHLQCRVWFAQVVGTGWMNGLL